MRFIFTVSMKIIKKAGYLPAFREMYQFDTADIFMKIISAS